jgi:flagellar M-ring protein FliF
MDQVKRIVGSLSARQLTTILVVAALVAGGIYGLTQWQREAGFRPLYTTSLAPEDAALVVQRLKESGIAYRLSANGGVISVPEDKVAELRLDMAAAGLPKSGRIGFEIFDKTNLGMTDFAEHVNYRRALEGELERSVMALTEVEQARVHISFPQESVFQEARQPAKASVLLRLRGNVQLPETAIPAITHLISSAVEGLAPEAVSVLDMRGNLLNRAKVAGDPGSGSGTSEAALEYRHSVEQDLTAKLDATLEPLVGAGRFRAAVSADTDLTSGEQSEEHFDPTQSVMVNSQKTEDVSSPSRTAGGIPGTASNLPDPAPAPVTVGGGSSRKTESANYQTSRTVKRTVLPQGGIKRLSVSVLLDQEVHFEGTGAQAKRVLTAPTPERLKVIHDLAAAAVGLSTERGDQLIVESLPFESTVNLEPPGAAPAPQAAPLTPFEQLKKNPKMLYGAAGGAAVLLAGLFFLVFKMLKKSPPPPAPARAPESLPAAGAEAAAPRVGGADSWAPSAISSMGAAALPALAPARIEVLTNQIRETAQKDGEICAGVLRGWLREEQT